MITEAHKTNLVRDHVTIIYTELISPLFCQHDEKFQCLRYVNADANTSSTRFRLGKKKFKHRYL